MKHMTRFAIACTALYGLLYAAAVHATDVSTRPLKADVLVKPNVIFAMDDSGSMDWEMLLNTNSGIMWWNGSSAYSGGTPVTSSTYGHAYLFHITGTGGNSFAYNSANGLLVPPTPEFAAARSSDFNPLYYNPAIPYRPWPAAYHNGALQTYGNASPTAARSHPAVSGSVTLALTTTQTMNNVYVQAGMRRPDYTTGSANFFNYPNWYPATYWTLDADCTIQTGYTSNCVQAPNGSKLRRVEIKPANYATTAEYDAAIQNFANWFTYYRKRKLMLAGSMGSVLEDLTGMRLGVAHFNARASSVTMYDTDVSDPTLNARRIAGYFYTNPASGGTPTADTLNWIGNQYRTNNNIIQYSCQRNNTFVVTDGFANGSAPTPPSYDPATSNSNAWPYQPTVARSLADIALSYYTNNLRNNRSYLTDGRVPAGDPTVRNPDLNTNLHMNTYGMTLGVRGSVWPMPTGQDPWSNPFTWPTPASDTPTSIDDLFHATVNGRGQMYIATDVDNTAQQVQDGLNDMLSNVGAQSSVSVSSVNLRRGDGKAYLGVYNPRGWSGDVTANAANPSNGAISGTPTWSAATQLAAKNWTTRVIATFRNGAGVPFTSAQVASVVNPGQIYGPDADVINYLRGDRTGENTTPATFRRRTSLIAAVINAKPAVSAEDRVVYAASSEGMVHALDADTGAELWAYVPGSGLSEIGKQTGRTWTFETFLDGSPELYTIGSRKVLVGGRGAAGFGGYYAIDVTSPRSLTTDAALAARVLWEFPAAPNTASITEPGLSVGRPVVVQTASHGTVALLTQGYNGPSTDGDGRLYMLNAETGALIHTFMADAGSSGGPNPGLAQVTPLINPQGLATHAYGGDELGNLWKFDLAALGNATRVAQLRDGGGTAQPVTTAPAIVKIGTDTVVLVGTGRLLGLNDFGSSAVNSFYAIKDTGTTQTGRTGLTAHTLTSQDANGERDLSGTAMNWSTSRGWYLDMPAGQQANTDPSVVFGAVVFTTNMATMSDCSASSYLYAVNIGTGLNVLDFASKRIGDFTVSGVTVLGFDGRGEHDLGFAFQRSTTTGVPAPGFDCEPGASGCVRQGDIAQGLASRKNSWRQIQR